MIKYKQYVIGADMQKILLTKIRLSWYLIFFLVLFNVLVYVLPDVKFTAAALTLFSVNSFLYGFYIAPILAGQKTRIEEMHKTIRNETNALFAIMLQVKKLPEHLRKPLKDLIEAYIRVGLVKGNLKKGEEKYEEIITFCMDSKPKDEKEIAPILDKIVANQQNRTLFHMQMKNGVYSNEWIIMFTLFSITLGFILLIDTGNSAMFNIVTAFLCTGLSMLLVVLTKLSTLTHKKAKQMWNPPKKLLETHFYRFD
jgi:hypothetical protein